MPTATVQSPHAPARREAPSPSGPRPWVLALALTLALPACSDRRPLAPANTPPPSALDAAAPPPGPTLTPEAQQTILATLRAMAHRPSCNRIMGCPGLVTLAQYGPAAVPLLADVLDKNRGADGYWYYQLIALLGQLGDPRALPVLHALLEDTRWEVPIRAAEALARLGAPESGPHLTRALARAESDPDAQLALAAAARVGLMRTDPERATTHRDAFVALVPTTAAGVEATPPVVLDILIALVRDARTPRALPGVRLAARHDNRFVRAQALDTLASFQDTGGIPYALALLDDKLPSIRQKALAALQRITGIHTMTDHAAWRQWCEKNNLATLPP